MLVMQGHEPVTYCGPRFEGKGSHVIVVTDSDREKWFGGPWDPATVFGDFDPASRHWSVFNVSCAAAIADRWEEGDMLGLIAGTAQEPLADSFRKKGHVLEWGVGYLGVIDDTHRAFESRSHQHFVYGQRNLAPGGASIDTVIPNCYDPADFELGRDDGYLLFMGRHTAEKGLLTVWNLAAQGARVISAGPQGPMTWNDEENGNIEYRGVVTGDDKRKLLAHASAVLVPTTYVEPFGGVAVEAMLSGVPVITSDFGAFTETVTQGVTGYRCSTEAEFYGAAAVAGTLRGQGIRRHAMKRWSLKAGAELYNEWLFRIAMRTWA